MEITLPTTEQLKGYANHFPMKDAKPVWQELYSLSFRDFKMLIPYLENPMYLIKPGRPTRLERIARAVLFLMSPPQREVAYKIITKKALMLKD